MKARARWLKNCHMFIGANGGAASERFRAARGQNEPEDFA
jgi:hypothetical protein